MIIRRLSISLTAMTLVFLPMMAGAATLTFVLDQNFGTVNAGGTVTVDITDDGVSAGDVKITVTNSTDGYLNDLFLNYTPTGDIAVGAVSAYTSIIGTSTQPGVSAGSQGFAIDFGFPNSPDSSKLNAGESASFVLSATGTLTVSGFNTFGGSPTGSQYHAAAHINAVLNDQGVELGSAKLGEVPEPATVLLFGSGLAGLGVIKRKRLAGRPKS